MDGDGDVAEPLPLDLAGGPRVFGARVDIGAHERATVVIEVFGDSVEPLVAGGAMALGADTSLELVIAGGGDEFQAGTYTLIEAGGGLTGTFADVTDLGGYVSVNGNGLTYDEVAGTVSLTLDKDLHPGDANLDCATDVSDRIIWNTNNFTSGTTFITGDFDGDGVTDVSDRIIWSTNNFTVATAAPGPLPAPAASAAGDFDETMAAGSFALLNAETARAEQDGGDREGAETGPQGLPVQLERAELAELAVVTEATSDLDRPKGVAPRAFVDEAAAAGTALELDLLVPMPDPIPGPIPELAP